MKAQATELNFIMVFWMLIEQGYSEGIETLENKILRLEWGKIREKKSVNHYWNNSNLRQD